MNKKNTKNQSQATFAGGCFWCMEAPFEALEGVINVTSGYTGGNIPNPSYNLISSGTTGHYEAIQITFNPKKISYSKLLEVFWQNIDPTDELGQFADKGSQYKTAIFYHNASQAALANESKKKIQTSEKYKKPIATKILKANNFYKAEDYHQNYYKKNPLRYNLYKKGSGREAYIKKNKLTPLQYKVTQKNGTEPPFNNKYWDNKQEGIYVDIVSGEPLFSSTDKYNSKTGWPSFTKPLEKENIIKKEDKRLFTTRTEIRSKNANSHLGHVFNDGPAPTGLRYCINSAALNFIPKKDLEKKGYSKYTKLFKKGD